jgi:putative Ca2+/H+ antiporter (TMEM165/GDT1 family)
VLEPSISELTASELTAPDELPASELPGSLHEAASSNQGHSISSTSPGVKAEVQIFLSTFLTIFLAEIGDKTQLAILLMSAESQSPWLVFLGAGLALIATSLCGVLLGKWLSTRVSPKVLDKSAGLLLLLISALLTWEFFQAN